MSAIISPDRAKELLFQAFVLALKEGPDMVKAMVKETGISEEELLLVGYDKEDYPELAEAFEESEPKQN